MRKKVIMQIAFLLLMTLLFASSYVGSVQVHALPGVTSTYNDLLLDSTNTYLRPTFPADVYEDFLWDYLFYEFDDGTKSEEEIEDEVYNAFDDFGLFYLTYDSTQVTDTSNDDDAITIPSITSDGDDYGGLYYDPDYVADAPNIEYYYNFATISLVPSESFNYYIEVTHADFSEDNYENAPDFPTGGGDTMLWIYEGSFNPANPLANLVAVNDDGSEDVWPYSKLSVELEADATYTLVVTSYEPESEGTVDLSIMGPATVEFISNQSEAASIPRVPQKRDPHTLLTGQVGGIQTTDLAYLVAIPEQWMDSTAKVEFWLDAATVTSKQEGYAYLDTAAATLKTAGSKLLESYDVRLMKRVTGQDGMVSEGEVALEYVRGNLTSRLPIPAQLQNTAHLGLCWIDDTGAVAFLESKRVTLDGVSYLEFTNNNFTTAYAFIADPNHAAVVG